MAAEKAELTVVAPGRDGVLIGAFFPPDVAANFQAAARSLGASPADALRMAVTLWLEVLSEAVR